MTILFRIQHFLERAKGIERKYPFHSFLNAFFYYVEKIKADSQGSRLRGLKL
ncbi:hypothetical protein EXIGUO8H_20216 [Exiguobacterium sp. 8H]|nr:hypothetical protein EXIGUO8A_11284 [Exiguobacterium sp. 8A]VXB47979.1 hypothetical protein EXIGUO8H_20216 [Exiguobacterium sp. 8H]